MNTIFRIARQSDSNGILAITRYAGAGLSSVPKTSRALSQYLQDSEDFVTSNKDIHKPSDLLANNSPDNKSANKSGRILFVAETDGVITGISGLIIKNDKQVPFYNFKQFFESRKSQSAYFDKEVAFIKAVNHFSDVTELGTLFLAPSARGKNIGRLLSLGRLAFINAHRAAFKETLMADIRGWYDVTGQSVFWKYFASRLSPFDLAKTDKLLRRDKDFLMAYLPSYPIMRDLLNPAVRDCFGRANSSSMGAYKLLESVGFMDSELASIIDGGPSVFCKAANTLIAHSSRAVQRIAPCNNGQAVMQYCGSGYDFTAIMGMADFDSATISQEAAKRLRHLEVGRVQIAAINNATSRHCARPDISQSNQSRLGSASSDFQDSDLEGSDLVNSDFRNTA